MSISIHSLARRLTDTVPHIQDYGHNFNSQPRKEADGIWSSTLYISSVFQFTASQGGWRSCHWQASCCTSYFNSQPRKEADQERLLHYAAKCISIHSLARRLTQLHPVSDLTIAISIHSLARRLTSFTKRTLSLGWLFQFTASQGGWHNRYNSICYHCKFQFTASQGGWQMLSENEKEEILFQFTASQGGWQTSCWTIPNFYIFQFTASQGGWPFVKLSSTSDVHFNSQPRKEADIKQIRFWSMESYFNSQPRKEADVPVPSGILLTNTFQFTASQGGWPCDNG